VSAGRRLSGLETAIGLGGVPGLDQEPDRADQPGAVGDHESVATGPVSPGGERQGGLVVPAPMEQEEGTSERAGPGAADAAAPRKNSSVSLGMAGDRGKCRMKEASLQ